MLNFRAGGGQDNLCGFYNDYLVTRAGNTKMWIARTRSAVIKMVHTLRGEAAFRTFDFAAYPTAHDWR